MDGLADLATDVIPGVVGEAPWHPPSDGGEIHLHQRPEVSRHPPSAQRGLDPTDQVPSASRLWHLRVPDQHNAAHESFHSSECGRWVEYYKGQTHFSRRLFRLLSRQYPHKWLELSYWWWNIYSPIPLAVRSKAWMWGGSIFGITGFNSAEGKNVQSCPTAQVCLSNCV